MTYSERMEAMREGLVNPGSWMNRAEALDRSYLMSLGYTVVRVDYPSAVVFCPRCRRALKEAGAYRLDFLCLHPERTPMWWDTKSRELRLGQDQEVKLEAHCYNHYLRVAETSGYPVYISWRFLDRWLVGEVGKLAPTSHPGPTAYSERHAVLWMSVPTYQLVDLTGQECHS